MPKNINRKIDINFEGTVYKDIPYDELALEFQKIGVEIYTDDSKGANFISEGEIQVELFKIVESRKVRSKKKSIIQILRRIATIQHKKD